MLVNRNEEDTALTFNHVATFDMVPDEGEVIPPNTPISITLPVKEAAGKTFLYGQLYNIKVEKAAV